MVPSVKCKHRKTALVSGLRGRTRGALAREADAVLLDETLYSQSASLPSPVVMGTRELKLKPVPSQRARIV